MQNTGNLNSLTQKLKAKTDRDRQEMENMTRQQFASLSQSLHDSSKNALNTTEAAILRQFQSLEQNVTSRCQMLNAAFGWKCLQALALTVCILIGVICSGWGLMSLLGNKITALQQEITVLSEQKESLEAQSARIWASFKGTEAFRDKDGKDYLLTLEGWTITHKGVVGKRDAWIITRK